MSPITVGYLGIVILIIFIFARMHIGLAMGVMLAILFGNVFAPLIDHFVIQVHVRRRRRCSGG